MKQKLVLLIDSEILARAKKYCLENRIDLSELVENFLKEYIKENPKNPLSEWSTEVKLRCALDLPAAAPM